MTTEEKLDIALNILRTRAENVPISEFASRVPHEMRDDFDRLLNTLEGRNFISQGHNVISITYEGEMFEGFVIEKHKKTLQEQLLVDTFKTTKSAKNWTIANTFFVFITLLVTILTLFYTCNPSNLK